MTGKDRVEWGLRREWITQRDGKGVESESVSTVLVLMNGDSGEQTFALPEGEWAVHADADRAATAPIGTARDRVTLLPHSGMVLAR